MKHALANHLATFRKLIQLLPQVETLAARMATCIRSGGKIAWMGNGGSAADCQHLAAELVGRFAGERCGLPSFALTTDTSILTAVANDYGYKAVFARQVQALCTPLDLVIGISTSGNSDNIITGLELAKANGIYTAALTGRSGGRLLDLVDLCLCVPSNVTARIQEAHIFIGHCLCEMVEGELHDFLQNTGSETFPFIEAHKAQEGTRAVYSELLTAKKKIADLEKALSEKRKTEGN